MIMDGVIENIASFASLEQAQELFPNHALIERTDANAHLQIGDPAP